MEGESNSAVAGVAVATVEGESAASTACDKDDRVTMGGRLGGGGFRDDCFGSFCGLFFGDGYALVTNFPFGGEACGAVKPLNELKEPDSLLVKLLPLL